MLERLYTIEWLSSKAYFGFFMGVAYTILGLFASLIIFPNDPGLVAIGFTSLLILPTLNLILEDEEEKTESKSISDSLKRNRKTYWVYLFIFLGILFTFSAFSMALPKIATSHFFEQQIQVTGYSGQAISASEFMTGIFFNNLFITFLTFCLALFYGTGGILMITWNASVWGTFFGVLARDAVSQYNPFVYFTLVMIAVTPHMILEVSAYIVAAIAGGILSKSLLYTELGSPKSKQLFKKSGILLIISLIFVILGAYVETFLPGSLLSAFGLR